MTDAFGPTDFFASGVGFDLAGAYLLARGLLSSPREISRLATTWTGYSSASVIASARDKVDGTLGLIALVTGFGLQAVGYFAVLASSLEESASLRRAIAAALITAASALLVFAIARMTRERWVLRVVRNVSHHDAGGERLDYPLGPTLVSFADALGHPKRPDEDMLEHLRRVFGVDEVFVNPFGYYQPFTEWVADRDQRRGP